MAGKAGGGSWKVAYADFVTAMMAFFLVMWICGQDQKVRKAVSEYFSDPLGAASSSSTSKPSRSGSIADHFLSSGTVPLEDKVATGQGRKSFTKNRLMSPATKVISDWLHHDKEAAKYWRTQTENQIESARLSREVREQKLTVESVAMRALVRQLQDEITREIPTRTDGIYRDLVHQALKDVNWQELAEDFVAQ